MGKEMGKVAGLRGGPRVGVVRKLLKNLAPQEEHISEYGFGESRRGLNSPALLTPVEGSEAKIVVGASVVNDRMLLQMIRS